MVPCGASGVPFPLQSAKWKYRCAMGTKVKKKENYEARIIADEAIFIKQRNEHSHSFHSKQITKPFQIFFKSILRD